MINLAFFISIIHRSWIQIDHEYW